MSEDKLQQSSELMVKGADYWRYEIGANVVPFDTRNRTPVLAELSPCLDSPISEDQHNQWKFGKAFDKGMAVVLGKIWHNKEKTGYYFVCVDLDNQKAIDEFTGGNIERLGSETIVEQHLDDPSRMHVYFYTKRSIKEKSSDKSSPYLSDKLDSNEVPAIEIKSTGIMFCTPSIHTNGQRYQIKGTHKPRLIDASTVESYLENIFKKYEISYLDKQKNSKSMISMQELFKRDTQIFQGHNRHEALMRAMESLIVRNRTILSPHYIKKLASNWNTEHCIPPLDEKEFDKQWHDAVKFIQRHHHLQQSSNNENDAKEKEVISVLEAKRKHQGNWRIIGKIVTVSEMYVIEVVSQENETLFRDARSIQLEDIEKLDENERLDVILFDDDIANVKAGEIVEITGNVVLVTKNLKKPSIKTVGVNATSIKYVNRKELVITQKDIATFEKFCEMENQPPIPRLVAMFAPNVIGHDDVKLGVLRSIVGGDDHGQRGGGRVNTFLVGDPGTAKSLIAEEATKIKPNSRFVSAPHASSKTITAIAENENETVSLKLGAIPLSRNAICAIDEITAFQPEEQGRLLDVLERGQFPLDKHGRHWEIPGDQESEKMVSVDNREQNSPNQNFIENDIASHMSHLSDSSISANQTPPRPQATCLKCREPIELFFLQVHIDGCQRSKG